VVRPWKRPFIVASDEICRSASVSLPCGFPTPSCGFRPKVILSNLGSLHASEWSNFSLFASKRVFLQRSFFLRQWIEPWASLLAVNVCLKESRSERPFQGISTINGAATARDPIDTIHEPFGDRLHRLARLHYGRRARSPLDFVRGSAMLMARSPVRHAHIGHPGCLTNEDRPISALLKAEHTNARGLCSRRCRWRCPVQTVAARRRPD